MKQRLKVIVLAMVMVICCLSAFGCIFADEEEVLQSNKAKYTAELQEYYAGLLGDLNDVTTEGKVALNEFFNNQVDLLEDVNDTTTLDKKNATIKGSLDTEVAKIKNDAQYMISKIIENELARLDNVLARDCFDITYKFDGTNTAYGADTKQFEDKRAELELQLAGQTSGAAIVNTVKDAQTALLTLANNARAKKLTTHIACEELTFTITAATCETACTVTAHCNDHTANESYTIGGELGHSFGEPTETVVVAATCDTDGQMKVEKFCTRCNKTFTETKAIIATGEHVKSDEFIRTDFATCTEAQYDVYKCLNCAGEFKVETGDALGHNVACVTENAYLVAGKEATCTTYALYYKSCDRCGVKVNETFEAKDLGYKHNFELVKEAQYLASEATCDKPATYNKVCTLCDAVDTVATEVGDALGHDYESVVTNPTCTADGYTTYTCKVCDSVKTDDTVPALGHEFETETVNENTLKTAATCTAKAVYYYTCTRCDENAKGAYATEQAKEVTTEYTQEMKDAKLADLTFENGAMLDHTFTAQETDDDYLITAMTCTQAAKYYKSCSVCGASSNDMAVTFEDGTPEGHKFTKTTTDYVKTAPTCTVDGVYYYSCSVCNTSSKGLEGEKTFVGTEEILGTATALGHDWGSFNIDEEATCLADGSKTRACSRCETTETEILTALGHNYTTSTQEAEKCGDSTVVTYTCTQCAAGTQGHTYSTYTVVDHVFMTETPEGKAPTCETKGVKLHYVCKCSGLFDENKQFITKDEDEAKNFLYIAPLGHKMQNVVEGCKIVDGKFVPGSIKLVCANKGCDQGLDVNDEFDIHEFTEQKVERGCETNAYTIYTCETCNLKDIATATPTVEDAEVMEVSVESANTKSGHDFGPMKVGVSPSCTDEGKKNHYICGNDWCENVGKYYLADEQGNRTETVVDDEGLVIDALGHEYEFTAKVEKACGENYNNAYYFCNVCDKYFVEEDEEKTEVEESAVVFGTAPAHAYANVDAKNSTCLVKGNIAHFKCTNEWCNKLFVENEVGGETTKVETTLDKVELELVDHTGAELHTYEYIEFVETTATCTEEGFNYYKCNLCGEDDFMEEQDALGHDYGTDNEYITVVPATCLVKGSITYDCQRCDYYEVKPTTGDHKLVAWSEGDNINDYEMVSDATCTAKAIYYYECEVCGKTAEECEKPELTFEYGNLDDHYFGIWHNPQLNINVPDFAFDIINFTKKADATCEDAAVYYKKCYSCEVSADEVTGINLDDYTFEYGEPNGHTYKFELIGKCGGELVDNVTVYTTAKTRVTCEKCDYLLEVVHDELSGIAKVVYLEETCTENRKAVYSCNLDGIPQEVKDAGFLTCECEYTVEIAGTKLNHNYESHDAEAKDCYNDGNVAYYTCSRCDAYFVDEGDEKVEASWDEIVIKTSGHDYVTVDAVEKACGEQYNDIYYFCNVCDKYFEDDGDDKIEVYESDVIFTAPAHNFNNVSAIDATCQEVGYNVDFRICINTWCKKVETQVDSEWTETTLEEVTIPKVEHNGAELHTEKFGQIHMTLINTTADCITAGIGIYQCDICGEEVQEEQEALGHTWGSEYVTVKAPTCTEDGEYKYTCTVCGQTKNVEIKALGHSGLTDENVISEADCDTLGVTEYNCGVCGETVTVTSPMKHDFTGEGTKVTAPTCTAQGYTTLKCNVCGYTEKTDTTEMVAHTFTAHNTDQSKYLKSKVTCTESYTFYTSCTVCGLSAEDEYKATENADLLFTYSDPLGHAYFAYEEVATGETPGFKNDITNFTLKTAATCKANAVYYKACDRCFEDSTETFELEGSMTAHVWNDKLTKVVECKVVEDEFVLGTTEKTCGDCGAIKVFNHKATSEKTEVTCTTNGFTTYTCQDCSKDFTAEVVTKLGHVLKSTVVDATCSAQGYTSVKCQREGCTFSEEKTDIKPALNHVVDGESQIIDVDAVAPTCTETGKTAGKKCTLCNVFTEKQNEVPALGHDWTVETVLPKYLKAEATCTTKAVYYKNCSRCEYFPTENADLAKLPTFENGDALGHTNSTQTTAPTCTKKGLKTVSCTRCDYTGTEPIDALGHDWGDDTINVHATCTTAGSKTHTCKREGCETTETDEIPALGHDYEGAGTSVTNATCTAGGYTTYTCQRADCTESHKGDYTQALGHNAGPEATCTTAQVCTRCSEELKAKLGHDLEETIISEAKCTQEGERAVRCKREGCGYSESNESIKALGHDYNGKVETTEGTCCSKATKVTYCTRCKTYQTEYFELDPENHEDEDSVDGEGYCDACRPELPESGAPEDPIYYPVPTPVESGEEEGGMTL